MASKSEGTDPVGEKRWPDFHIAWSDDWKMWVFAGLEDETDVPTERYLPASRLEEVEEKLRVAEQAGDEWHDERDAAEQRLADLEAALTSDEAALAAAKASRPLWAAYKAGEKARALTETGNAIQAAIKAAKQLREKGRDDG